MGMRTKWAIFLAIILVLNGVGCGASRMVKKDSLKAIRKVSIATIYCPAAITIDNQRQAVGFHVVDSAIKAQQKKPGAVAEFRPRGLFLLNRAHDEAVVQFSKAFGWNVRPVAASIQAARSNTLRQWSDERRDALFPMMMSFDGVPFLWVEKGDSSLQALVKEWCATNGFDAVMLLSFNFTYSKSWFGTSGVSAKARTFTGVQIIDRNGELIVATSRADERERAYSVMADDTMPLKGWTADINDTTIRTFDSATKKSVANMIRLIQDELK